MEYKGEGVIHRVDCVNNCSVARFVRGYIQSHLIIDMVRYDNRVCFISYLIPEDFDKHHHRHSALSNEDHLHRQEPLVPSACEFPALYLQGAPKSDIEWGVAICFMNSRTVSKHYF